MPPPYLGGDMSGMMPNHSDVYDQMRKEYPNYQMKMNEQMFPFNPYTMMPPSMTMPMMPNKPHYKMIREMVPNPNYTSQYPYQ